MLAERIVTILYIINLLLAGALIFLERRNTATTWAWLMVLLFLPGLGFLIYLIFGQNLSRLRLYRLTADELAFAETLVHLQREQIRKGRMHHHDRAMTAYQDLIQMNLTDDYAFFTQDNEVEVVTDGQAKFSKLLERIEGARDHIHLMYYIFRADRLGREIAEALARKAEAGVKVRVLLDAVGSPIFHRKFWRRLRKAGGEVAFFFPSRIPFLNIRVNYRNHRKLVIIDGEYGFIGGFNVGDEYVGRDKRLGYWRDTHLVVRGSAVLLMQVRFLLDWNLATGRRLAAEARYLPTVATTGTVGMQIVSSGPDSERRQIRNAFVKMIYSAKRSVYLQSPYFIPDESLMTALRSAALSGVDVRVMLPGKVESWFVYWASCTYVEELLRDGVKCYTYEGGFLHAKTMVVDETIATVGTANLDTRSFRLNFETNALIYDSGTAEQLAQHFCRDLEQCRGFTLAEYRRRPLFTRFMESLARLLSPLF
jgi:cardiolipin synthase A/B